MQRKYREGAIGALPDGYEKALNGLKSLLIKIPEDEFIKVYNKYTHVTKSSFYSIKSLLYL